MHKLSETDRQSLIEDLEGDIRSYEEKLCDIQQKILDTESIINEATETKAALLTDRQRAFGKLQSFRDKLQDLKTGNDV